MSKIYFLIYMVLFSKHIFAQSSNIHALIDNLNNSSENLTCHDDTINEKCARELCKNAVLPPSEINSEALKSFAVNSPQQLAPQLTDQIQAMVDRKIELIKNAIAEIKNSSKEQLIGSISTPSKKIILMNKFHKECLITPSMSKPLNKRFSLTCTQDLKDSKLEKSFEQNLLEYINKDLDYAYKHSYLTWDEVVAKIPEKKSLLRASLETMNNNPDFRDLDSVKFLNQNWDRFEVLSFGDKLRYIKMLSELVDSTNNLCHKSECNDYFDAYVSSSLFQNRLTDLEKKINDPQFRDTAIASLEIEKLLDLNRPTENELKKFDEIKSNVITEILNYQKKNMSIPSYKTYKGQLMSLKISYDTESYDSSSIGSSGSIHKNDIISILVSYDSFSPFSLVGATLGPSVSLVTDKYIDPKHKKYYVEDFEIPEIRSSYYSIKNPLYASQILAHEIGHHLSSVHQHGLLSSETDKTLTKAKECIIKRYKNEQDSSKASAGDYYLEEEFADEFEYVFNSQNSHNLFCNDVMIGLNNTGRANLDILNSKDHHQTAFWRSLTYQMSLNKNLPSSCQEVLVQEAGHYQYKKCL